MSASYGSSLHTTCLTFMNQAAHDAGLPEALGLQQNTDLIHNDYLPSIEVDPQTYRIKADGVLPWCETAEALPMAQRCFLF